MADEEDALDDDILRGRADHAEDDENVCPYVAPTDASLFLADDIPEGDDDNDGDDSKLTEDMEHLELR